MKKYQGVALLRDCILIGGGIAAYSAPAGFSQVAEKAKYASNVLWHIFLIFKELGLRSYAYYFGIRPV